MLLNTDITYTLLERKKLKYSKLQQGFDLTVTQILILIYIILNVLVISPKLICWSRSMELNII